MRDFVEDIEKRRRVCLARKVNKHWSDERIMFELRVPASIFEGHYIGQGSSPRVRWSTLSFISFMAFF